MTPNNVKRWMLWLSLALVLTVTAAASIGVTTTYAYEGEDPDSGRTTGQTDSRLEKCFERLNEWYRVQDENLTKAYRAAGRVEELLEKAAERGLDISEIEALVPELYAAIERAEASHNAADEIISLHAGYDDSGKVVDPQLALETCRSGRDALASAKNSLIKFREIMGEIIELARQLRRELDPSAQVAG